MDLLDIIRSAGRTASRVGNNLALGTVIGAYGGGSSGWAGSGGSSSFYSGSGDTQGFKVFSDLGGYNLTSLKRTGQERIETPNSSFVSSVDVDWDNKNTTVNMNSGYSYSYRYRQHSAELNAIKTYAETTGHFGKMYWTDAYTRHYDSTARPGKPSKNRIN